MKFLGFHCDYFHIFGLIFYDANFICETFMIKSFMKNGLDGGGVVSEDTVVIHSYNNSLVCRYKIPLLTF